MELLGSAYYGSDYEITEPPNAPAPPQVLEAYASEDVYTIETTGLEESYALADIVEPSSTSTPATQPSLSSYYGSDCEENEPSTSSEPADNLSLEESYSSETTNDNANKQPVEAALATDAPMKSKAAMLALTNFCERFQRIREQEESEKSYEMLYKLSHDFGFLAELYGRIIISEISLHVNQKSIKPVSLGGQAGGDKFIVSGILFKFASGDFSFQMYGNEENAQKIAAHELKGLNAFYLSGVPGLSYPLMAVIKYLGFCLIAVSLLPIGENTLVYGSSDAGKTMHFDDPDVYESMKQVALKLNLKPHKSGICSPDSPDMWGPGDIEGHRGSDGRKYVLDFARVFPPECPMPNQIVEKGALFYKLLRSELVRQNPVPLSSDALVGWGRNDPNKSIHNREVYEATVRLRSEIIPAFALKLSSEFQASVTVDNESSIAKFSRTIVHHLHAAGINARHLGLVRAAVTNDDLKAVLLSEMVIRLMKCKLNYKLRKVVTRSVGIANEQCLDIAVQTLNLLVHTDDPIRVEPFWTDKIKYLVGVKFEGGLTDEEKSDSYDLFESLKKCYPVVGTLPFRFIAATGITLSTDASVLIGSAGYTHPVFVSGDVVSLTPIVKNLVIGDVAYACATFLKAIRLANAGLNGDKQAKLSAHRLFQMVQTRLQLASHIGDHFAEKMIRNPSMAPLFEQISSSSDIDPITSDKFAGVIDLAINLSAAQKAAAVAGGSQDHIAAEYIRAAKLMRRCGAIQNARAMVDRAKRLNVESEDVAVEDWRVTYRLSTSVSSSIAMEEMLKKYPNSARGHFYFLVVHLGWLCNTTPSADDVASLLRSTTIVIKHNPEWLRRTKIRVLIGCSCIQGLLFICDPSLWVNVKNGEAIRESLMESLAHNLIDTDIWSLSRSKAPEQVWIELLNRIATLQSSTPLEVDLKSSSISNRALDILAQSHGARIEKLSLSDVGSPEAPLTSLEFLRHMPNLKKLDLSCAAVEAKALEMLPDLLGQSLESLRVDGIHSHWTPQLVQECILKAPALVVIGVPAGNQLDGASAKDAELEANAKRKELISVLTTEITLKKFDNLRVLGFRGVLNLPLSFFDDINPLLGSLPQLVVLDLFGSVMPGEACEQIVQIVHPSLLAVVTGGGGLLAFSGSSSRRVDIQKTQSPGMGAGSGYSALWKDPPPEIKKYVQAAGLSNIVAPNQQVHLFSVNLPATLFTGNNLGFINSALILAHVGERSVPLGISVSGTALVVAASSPLFRVNFNSAISTMLTVGGATVICGNSHMWGRQLSARDSTGQAVCKATKHPFGGLNIDVEPRRCMTAWVAAFLFAASR